MFQTLETVRDGEELLFLYHLIEGHVKTSYASHIALQAGLPQELVKRGTEVSRTSHIGIKACQEIAKHITQVNEEQESYHMSYHNQM